MQRVVAGFLRGRSSTAKPPCRWYVALSHKQGVPLAGQPKEIGLWTKINGNSSQGRLIFELEDATGQKWSEHWRARQPIPPCLTGFEGVIPAELRPRFQPLKMADWNTETFMASAGSISTAGDMSASVAGQYPGMATSGQATASGATTGMGRFTTRSRCDG